MRPTDPLLPTPQRRSCRLIRPNPSARMATTTTRLALLLLRVVLVLPSARVAADCTFPGSKATAVAAGDPPPELALNETCSPSSASAGAALDAGEATTAGSPALYADTRRQVYDMTPRAHLAAAALVKTA